MSDLTKENILNNIDDVIKVQCYDGNYNDSPYMLGLANGLILARSIITGDHPEFMSVDENKFLCDLPRPNYKVVAEGSVNE